jgi:hypothetical protein
MHSTRRAFARTIIIILLAAPVAIASYLYGAMSADRQLWPFPLLHEMRAKLYPYRHANGEVEDSYHRLVGYRGKQVTQCPAQNDKTIVLLIIGQSNAANSGGQRQLPRDRVVNYFDGKCYAASSPLLGTTGIEGELWTLLGGKLIATGAYDHVILVPSAMSGSKIVQWQDNAEFNLMLLSVLSGVARHYDITHILWQQGEADVGDLTKEQYEQKFMSLVDSIRRMQVNAPIYVAVSTKCEVTDLPWTKNNPIAEALRSLPKPEVGILPGADSDSLVEESDRLDDCHFGASGEEKVASAWARILIGH